MCDPRNTLNQGKLADEAAYVYTTQAPSPAQTNTEGGSYRSPSIAEQHEKEAAYHADRSQKLQRAAAFFIANPQFEEFINLIRQGVISI